MSEPVELAAYNLDIVWAGKIEGEEGAGGKQLKILREIFASAAPALATFQGVEHAFVNVIRAVHESDASAEWLRDGNGVSPEELSVTIEVGQNDIDRMPDILGWAALGATLTQRDIEILYRLADIT